MSLNPQLSQLENSIRRLVSELNKLHADNDRLTDELALVRQDFEAQTHKLDEAHSQIHTLTTTHTTSKDEQASKLQFQEQQIQLLERERLNLRDQIAFLQNTIQNKEKDWQEKFDSISDAQTEQQKADEERIVSLQSALQEAEEKTSLLTMQLDSEKQFLQSEKDDLQQKNTELTEQLATLQAQLTDTQQRLNAAHTESDKWQADFQAATDELMQKEQEFAANLQAEQDKNNTYSDELAQLRKTLQTAQDEFKQKEQDLIANAKAEQDKLNTQLAQEAERFRSEFVLQKQIHEQNIAEINTVLKQQQDAAKIEKTTLQEQIFQLNQKNQEYRHVLQQSAEDIRALLVRLPALDLPKSEISDEIDTPELNNAAQIEMNEQGVMP